MAATRMKTDGMTAILLDVCLAVCIRKPGETAAFMADYMQKNADRLRGLERTAMANKEYKCTVANEIGRRFSLSRKQRDDAKRHAECLDDLVSALVKAGLKQKPADTTDFFISYLKANRSKLENLVRKPGILSRSNSSSNSHRINFVLGKHDSQDSGKRFEKKTSDSSADRLQFASEDDDDSYKAPVRKYVPKRLESPMPYTLLPKSGKTTPKSRTPVREVKDDVSSERPSDRVVDRKSIQEALDAFNCPIETVNLVQDSSLEQNAFMRSDSKVGSEERKIKKEGKTEVKSEDASTLTEDSVSKTSGSINRPISPNRSPQIAATSKVDPKASTESKVTETSMSQEGQGFSLKKTVSSDGITKVNSKGSTESKAKEPSISQKESSQEKITSTGDHRSTDKSSKEKHKTILNSAVKIGEQILEKMPCVSVSGTILSIRSELSSYKADTSNLDHLKPQGDHKIPEDVASPKDLKVNENQKDGAVSTVPADHESNRTESIPEVSIVPAVEKSDGTIRALAVFQDYEYTHETPRESSGDQSKLEHGSTRSDKDQSGKVSLFKKQPIGAGQASIREEVSATSNKANQYFTEVLDEKSHISIDIPSMQHQVDISNRSLLSKGTRGNNESRGTNVDLKPALEHGHIHEMSSETFRRFADSRCVPVIVCCCCDDCSASNNKHCLVKQLKAKVKRKDTDVIG